MSTNIRYDHVRAFEALTSGQHESFALFSCFVNGAVTAMYTGTVPTGSITEKNTTNAAMNSSMAPVYTSGRVPDG